jgi:uncharacterized membrane protein YqjE
LLRHLAAYVDLASLDLTRASREIAAEFLASAIMALCGLFALFMACLAVIACTWNTPHRLTAIVWMGGGFLLAAIAAALYRARVVREKSRILESVRREWHQDRVILERILAEQD